MRFGDGRICQLAGEGAAAVEGAAVAKIEAAARVNTAVADNKTARITPKIEACLTGVALSAAPTSTTATSWPPAMVPTLLLTSCCYPLPPLLLPLPSRGCLSPEGGTRTVCALRL